MLDDLILYEMGSYGIALLTARKGGDVAQSAVVQARRRVDRAVPGDSVHDACISPGSRPRTPG